MPESPVIENISDTARWVAFYRAVETERPDAHFRDPLARVLAGEQGEKIAREIAGGMKHAWALIVRTKVLDEMILDAIASRGVDLVVNCAAGLDTRPYRLALPPELSWVEVDLPGILRYKESKLEGQVPVCRLERIPQDLTDVPGRRALLAKLAARGKRLLLITEGLLVYLPEPVVVDLAKDFHAAGLHYWLQDYSGPKIVKMMMRKWGKTLAAGNSRFQFAPAEGPEFFARHGWRTVVVRYTLPEAARLNREMRFGWLYRWLSRLAPEAKRLEYRQMNGYALLERA